MRLDLSSGEARLDQAYFRAPGGDLLAVDEGGSVVWALADLSGTVRSYADTAAAGHWRVAHRNFDGFGLKKALPADASDDPPASTDADGGLLRGNDAALFTQMPVVFQGGVWDAEAGLYDLGGRAYDPFSGRWVTDGGGPNGYARGGGPDRERIELPTDFGFTHEERTAIYGSGLVGSVNYGVGEGFRETLGDDYLAGASDAELIGILSAGGLGGYVAGVGGVAIAGYYGLGALGTATVVGATGGAGEYLGATLASATLGGNGPTATGLALSTLGGAATGGALHGAGLFATPLARGGLTAARAAGAATQQFVYDTGLPFARGFNQALVGGPLLASADPYSTVAIAIARGAQGGIQELLEQSRRFERVARGYVQRELGETVIRSQHRVGAADLGFDFLSFTGTGAQAKLFINEVKFITGRAGSRRFSVFNLGRTAGGNVRTENFDRALGFAIDAIEHTGLDRATRGSLIAQLENQSASIRLIGSSSKGTRFDPKINDKIGRATGFLVGEGFQI